MVNVSLKDGKWRAIINLRHFIKIKHGFLDFLYKTPYY